MGVRSNPNGALHAARVTIDPFLVGPVRRAPRLVAWTTTMPRFFTPRIVRRLTPWMACLIAILMPSTAFAQKPSFTVGWSVYVGWNPYHYLAKSGILRKWSERYGINIKVQRFDYAPSLDAFVAKNIDACAMTNMEALDMPAAAGVDTTAILIGDYSNG